MFQAISYFIIGGIIGRLRGSGIFPNFVSRFILWGGIVGIAIYILNGSLINSLVGLILAGIGASFGYWGQFGIAEEQNRNFKNYFKLSIMGMVRFSVLFSVSFLAGFGLSLFPAVLAGISFVPSYLLGIPLSRHIRLPILTSYTEWGELFFWGTIYGVFVLCLS